MVIAPKAERKIGPVYMWKLMHQRNHVAKKLQKKNAKRPKIMFPKNSRMESLAPNYQPD